jgi:predicted AlkP superfamily pyrophosphatase or phosphodiesterase
MDGVDTVLLFSIDGMRPDGMQQANTPHIDRLIQEGALTLTAQTVLPSITLPCHTSMFRGVSPERHGITANTWIPMARPIPSIFDVVHRAGRRTASFYGWEQLRDLASPGSLDFSFYRNVSRDLDGGHDQEIARAACDYLRRERPGLALIYLGLTDEIGHIHGWMSPQYIEAIEGADRAAGQVLETLDAIGMRERTAIILQSDHGGEGFTHTTGAPADTIIPWLIAGPGVRRSQSPVHITDTAATIAHLLGLEAPREWTGRPVHEVFYETSKPA